MTANKRRKALLLGRISGLAALMVMLEACPGGSTSPQTNANEKIGFPTTASAVTVDGIPTEAAWNSSFKFFLEDGAAVSAAFMRGMADASNVYLYFEAEDTSFDAFDAVVLAFTPSNAAADYHRLHIYPCSLIGGGVCPGMGGSVVGGLDATVESGTGSLAGSTVTWGALATGAPPAGMEIKSNVAPGGMANRWSVEIKIPRNATYAFPATNYFGLYADVISTDVGAGTAEQYSWPLGNFIGADPNDAFGTIQTAPLPLARWGNATLDTSVFAAGLQITGMSNIGTDPTAISLTGPNEFFATAANYPAGTAADPDATDVTATFKINNIGLNPSWTWTNIPSATNPTSPGQTINALEYMPFSSGDWTLATSGTWQTSGMTEQAFFTANPHQCVQVELNHSGGMISRYFNMTFVNVNSPFEIAPQIATGAWRKGYETASGVNLRELFLNTGPDFRWTTTFDGADPTGEHRWRLKSFEGESQKLKSSILPDASLQLPREEYKLDPVALGGKPMDIPVKPGTVVTLLADGEAVINGRRVSAAGMSLEAAKRAEINVEPVRDVLRPGSTSRVGALLGSFDGFQTTFAIGTGSTLFVPSNAERLSIGFAPGLKFEGGGFVVNAIATEPGPVALNGASLEMVRGAQRPLLLPLGGNLPMHIVRGSLDTGKFITINRKQFRVGVPMGSYGAFIRSVRGSPTGPQLAPAGPRVARDIRVRPVAVPGRQ